MTAGSHPQNNPERHRAGDDADEGKAGCVDTGLLQRQSTEQRVARESNHREQSQDEQPNRWHFYDWRKGGTGQSSASATARRSSASRGWMTPSAAIVWAQALRTFFLICGTAWLKRSSAGSR